MSETTAPPEVPIEQIAPPIEPPAAETTPAEQVSEEPKVYDQAYVDKLRKESAGYRTKLREVEPIVEEYNKAQDAAKSELQRAQEDRDRIAAERDEFERKLTVADLARTHSLTEEDINFLGSGTREELEARAAYWGQLRANITPSDSPAPPSNRPVETLRPGASPQPPAAEDNAYPAQWRPATREQR